MKTLIILLGTLAFSILTFLYVKVAMPFFVLLDHADKWLMELLNFDGGPVLDNIFYFISSKTAWIPVGVFFICAMLSSKKYRGQTFFVILAIALTVTICDQVSSSMIKPAVERLRPSHSLEISGMLHYVNNYHGGRFGFCSSHAANATGVFMLISLLFRKRWITYPLLVWTVLVCYSRIYLGVHYPGDIICGALIGVGAGYFVFRLYVACITAGRRWLAERAARRRNGVTTSADRALD